MKLYTSQHTTGMPLTIAGCNGIRLALLAIIALVLCIVGPAKACAEGTNNTLHADVQETIALLKKQDSTLARWFDGSQGYVVFPSVAKGGMGIGAAHGNGEVYAKGGLIGTAAMTQITIGLQLGGQVYSEVIFFETEQALNGFKASRYALSAQATATAAAEGCAANAKYDQGVAIFTMSRGGLMYEASVGGQKFHFKPIVKK